MSYILEALKKAQAERQLSSAPTIHSQPLHAAPQESADGSRVPLLSVLAIVTLLGAIAAAGWWRQPASAPAATVVAEQPAPVAVPATPAAAPVAPPVPAVLAPAAPPVAPVPLAMARIAAAPVAKAPPVVARKPAPPPTPLAQPEAAPVKANPVAAEPVPAAVEDGLPFARDLPEPSRRDLPQVVFGGYMYSKNPADRLLLIDKVLRHEGEEVAPGLVLEKLLPKAAVMNFRGTRYRVAY